MICDMRCVACNLPVAGREGVAIRKTKPPLHVECKRCGTKQSRETGDDLTDYAYAREE